MFKVLCITGEEGKTGFFGRNNIFQRELSFENEQIKVNEVIVKTRNGKIRKKVRKKLEKICENEANVYTAVDSIKSMEKNKNNARVMNYLPLVSFKKWANVNGISLSEEPFALVVGELDKEEKEMIFKIASCIKLLTVYNCKDMSFADEIIEKTGLCVKMADSEIKENIVIYTKENLCFEDRRTGNRVYDVSIRIPDEMKAYISLPAERILENFLKNDNGEKLLKKNKLKIDGFYREKA